MRRAIGVGVLALAAVFALAAVRSRPLRRVVVEGASMRPTLEPGDRLLVRRPPPWRAYRTGDVVALRDPRRPDRLLVKRVARVGPAGLEVRGDNPAASTDSRHFGPVVRGDVVGLVFHRYVGAGRPGDTIR